MSGRENANASSRSTRDANTSSDSLQSSSSSSSSSGSHWHQRRRIGDGLDMRRPMMAVNQRAIIDLTQDEPSPPPALHALSARRPTEPSDRVNRSEPSSTSGTMEQPLVVDSDDLYEPERPPVIDVDSLDFDLAPTNNPNIHHPVHHRPGPSIERHHHNIAPLSLSRNLPPLPRPSTPRHRQASWADELHQRRSIAADMLRSVRIPGFGLAGPMMDYEVVGFDLNADAGPSAAAEPPVPTYDAPSPPRKGFSRNPKEDEVAVCPNCNEELGVGETDIKRQVWVVKSCGHVGFPSRIHSDCLALFDFLIIG